jgi:predicted esterase
VHSVAALAPWLPKGEPIPPMNDRNVLLAHGTADRTTDPRETARLAKTLREEGVEVELHEFIGGHHSMLFPARPWHDIVGEFMARTLLTPAAGASRT